MIYFAQYSSVQDMCCHSLLIITRSDARDFRVTRSGRGFVTNWAISMQINAQQVGNGVHLWANLNTHPAHMQPSVNEHHTQYKNYACMCESWWAGSATIRSHFALTLRYKGFPFGQQSRW